MRVRLGTDSYGIKMPIACRARGPIPRTAPAQGGGLPPPREHPIRRHPKPRPRCARANARRAGGRRFCREGGGLTVVVEFTFLLAQSIVLMLIFRPEFSSPNSAASIGSHLISLSAPGQRKSRRTLAASSPGRSGSN